eukprot:TRINITY_DN107840_c0_g1_i1.p1 TRINITY_DN107840_c0_g1~~TRINITY_DN107840_c0_g1_i1.p1  ORF type:complete len:261 (-),score=60.68 TRINITY_DN107840_c0_g1_i1:11-718(-)
MDFVTVMQKLGLESFCCMSCDSTDHAKGKCMDYKDDFVPVRNFMENLEIPEASSEADIIRVRLDKTKGPLGIMLDKVDRIVCMVGAIEDKGQVSSWNGSCPDDLHVREYDRLVAVNGEIGNSEFLVQKLTACTGGVELAFMRPVFQTVEVKEGSRSLDLDLVINDNGACVKLKSLEQDGASTLPSLTGKLHNRIVDIDGESMSTSKLLDLMKSKQFTAKVCIWEHMKGECEALPA